MDVNTSAPDKCIRVACQLVKTCQEIVTKSLAGYSSRAKVSHPHATRHRLQAKVKEEGKK